MLNCHVNVFRSDLPAMDLEGVDNHHSAQDHVVVSEVEICSEVVAGEESVGEHVVSQVKLEGAVN